MNCELKGGEDMIPKKPIFKTCSVCGGLFGKLDWVYRCPACGNAYHHSHLKRIDRRVKCVLCGAPHKKGKTSTYSYFDGRPVLTTRGPPPIRNDPGAKFPEKKKPFPKKKRLG